MVVVCGAHNYTRALVHALKGCQEIHYTCCSGMYCSPEHIPSTDLLEEQYTNYNYFCWVRISAWGFWSWRFGKLASCILPQQLATHPRLMDGLVMILFHDGEVLELICWSLHFGCNVLQCWASDWGCNEQLAIMDASSKISTPSRWGLCQLSFLSLKQTAGTL